MNDSIIGYAGVDWAVDAHAVCVVDGDGRVVVEFDVTNSAEGLRGSADVCSEPERVGAIERPDGPVVDAVLDAGWKS